jgi:DNA-binding NtrC family response regulator
VRLITATHRNLKTWSEEGKFRSDLYYRLGVFTIHLPPLRERGDDLPLLVRHYVRRFSRELGREVQEVAPEALARLHGYDWPGNIRELQSVLKQALLRASGTVLLPTFLPDLSGKPQESEPADAANADLDLDGFLRQRLGPDAQDLYTEAHRLVDQFLLPRILNYTHGNQHQAARLLGIARQTLRQKLRDLGLHVTHTVESDEDSAPSTS